MTTHRSNHRAVIPEGYNPLYYLERLKNDLTVPLGELAQARFEDDEPGGCEMAVVAGKIRILREVVAECERIGWRA